MKKYANTNTGNGTAADSRLYANTIQKEATTMTCGPMTMSAKEGHEPDDERLARPKPKRWVKYKKVQDPTIEPYNAVNGKLMDAVEV